MAGKQAIISIYHGTSINSDAFGQQQQQNKPKIVLDGEPNELLVSHNWYAIPQDEQMIKHCRS